MKYFFLTALYLLSIQISAQCTLACDDSANVNMDSNCNHTVTEFDVLENHLVSCPSGVFIIDIMASGSTIPGSPTISSAYVGQTLSYTVNETNSGTSCFGNIVANDVTPPIIDCVDITVECTDTSSPLPNVVDACGATLTLNNQTTNLLTCDPDNVAETIYSFVATDLGNNTAACDLTVAIARMDISSVVFPSNLTLVNGTEIECNAVIPLDGNGNPDPTYSGAPTYLGLDIFTNQSSTCNVVITYTDNVIVNTTCLKKINRTWDVTETWCGSPLSTGSVQVIEIADTQPPTPFCNAGFSIDLNATGQYNMIPEEVDAGSFDNCGNITTSISPNTFDCNDVGINVVTLIVTDECGTSEFCESAVTVSDNSPPSVSCISSVFLNIDATNTATLDPLSAVASVDDNCSNIALSSSQMLFDCSDLGINTVTITATDASGNTSSCFTNVEILDPMSFCPPPPSLIITGTLISNQTYIATNFIQFDATVIPGVSITLQAPDVFTVNGCEIQLGGELDINP